MSSQGERHEKLKLILEKLNQVKRIEFVGWVPAWLRWPVGLGPNQISHLFLTDAPPTQNLSLRDPSSFAPSHITFSTSPSIISSNTN